MYTVWLEGYSATGNRAPAQCLGETEAPSFKEACQKLLKEQGWNMAYYNAERNTFWFCDFYDNETDAREHYG